MPSLAAFTAARILEGMVLQAFRGNADPASPREQPLAVRRHQVRHGSTEPHVAMQPEPSVHRVNHAITPPRELDPLVEQGGGVLGRWNGWHAKRRARARLSGQRQTTTPSGSPGVGALTWPQKMAQVSGNDWGCVAFADQPPVLAAMIVRYTPFEPLYFKLVVSVV